jgi:hypothetical protein
MYICLKDEYNALENEYKTLRKKIREQNKVSWEEAGDLAGEYIDNKYGSYDYVNKFDDGWDELIDSIEIMISTSEGEKHDYYDRELYLSYGEPSYSVKIYLNKKLTAAFNSKDTKDDILSYLNKIKESTVIKEYYLGSTYNYSGRYYDWNGCEIYLKHYKKSC